MEVSFLITTVENIRAEKYSERNENDHNYDEAAATLANRFAERVATSQSTKDHDYYK